MGLIYKGQHGLIDGRFGGIHATEPGTTKRTGTPNSPTRVRVVLMHQPSGRIVREMWSDELTGAYRFKNLAPGIYFVVSFDHTGAYNGEVITDIVVPAP